jgi:pimeloyl-ACP methyl ester carboxylesterase
MRLLKKILKITAYIFLALLIVFLMLIHFVFQPKSDKKIRESIEGITLIHKSFDSFSYRLISSKKELDTTLPNLLFVHGSPGSMLDYEAYFNDEELNKKANLITYERVGYGIDNAGDIQDIAFEAKLLNSLTDSIGVSNTILVGYSYGGPIALASQKKYKKVVLLAAAVYSEVEPMFWFLNFYKWKVTRWLIPKKLQSASKEKLQHQDDLRKHQENWSDNPSEIYVIHGDKDWIVPYGNSEFLEQQFASNKFEMLILKDAGHELIWSRFDEIKSELIKVIEE